MYFNDVILKCNKTFQSMNIRRIHFLFSNKNSLDKTCNWTENCFQAGGSPTHLYFQIILENITNETEQIHEKISTGKWLSQLLILVTNIYFLENGLQSHWTLFIQETISTASSLFYISHSCQLSNCGKETFSTLCSLAYTGHRPLFSNSCFFCCIMHVDVQAQC